VSAEALSTRQSSRVSGRVSMVATGYSGYGTGMKLTDSPSLDDWNRGPKRRAPKTQAADREASDRE